jgi:hypothetical protein
MVVLGALSVLALLSSPIAAPKASQQLNVNGNKVKEAFQKLDAAWDMGVSGRPKLYTGWGILGGMVTGPKNYFGWTVSLKKNQTLSFSITGDKSVRKVMCTLVNAANNSVIMSLDTTEPSLWHSYTAPADGRYSIRVSRESANNVPAYMVLALESNNGPTISKTNMQGLAQNMGAAFTEATSGADALILPTNVANLYIGSFKTNETKSIFNMNFVKGPWAIAAGADGPKETLNLTIKNEKGMVLANDPGDEELAYCVIAEDAPKSRLELTSVSKAPRFCFVATFKAK